MHDEPPDSAPGAAGSTPPVTPVPATAPPPSEPEPDGPADPDAAPENEALADESAASPAWAEDLRKLYNAVVEEPLPESLIALLSQLDSED